MEITCSAVRYGKNAVPHRFAAVATAWIVLGSSGGNVCAQNNGNQTPIINTAYESGFMPLLSEFETSGTPTNPPAIFKEQFIGKMNWRGIASSGTIIQIPAIAQLDPALIHTANASSLNAQDEGMLERVTVTDGWTPVVPETPNSVTLWDEIAPPSPGRAPAHDPADVAVHSTLPGDAADIQTHTTQ